MPLPVFSRADWTDLWITLSSNETLGILDSSYIEDYDGVDGQVSLFHVPTEQRVPVLMAESIASEIAPHEVFRGSYPLAPLPDGEYQIQGRVRDVAGNLAILSAFSAPNGAETIEPLAFLIEEGGAIAVDVGPLRLHAGLSIRTVAGKLPVIIARSYAFSTRLFSPPPEALHVRSSVIDESLKLRF